MSRIGDFIHDHKRAVWGFFCGCIGVGVGIGLADDNTRNAVGEAWTKYMMIPPNTHANSAQMDFQGRMALRDKQEHELEMLKLKQKHELKMAELKAEDVGARIDVQ